ncbi:larval cuticle protein LCP-17-like [Aethina tumida]|uniref:larval cuticle protein LCP-17-like n=1 Tax=Aethina tumida TaxID=116153 RepID=UPI002148F8CB|nr:larval cuticle protein LCP-17-like [Aethina tumida]
MKLIILSVALFATVFADVSHLADQQVPIIRLESDISPEGSYQWALETGNGIAAQEAGQIRALGPEQVAKSAQGSFQWTSPEGVPVAIQYVADENGYQPSGDAIPQPPPIPIAIQRALEYIAAHPPPPERP